MVGTLTVLGIAGSLRRASYNRALLNAAVELAPQDMAIEIWDSLGDMPPFNEDVEKEGDPPVVADLKARIAAADGLLIATPEYNHNVPGVLKNALDWASRPADRTPLKGKPTGIIGASPSKTGTIMAQQALRPLFVWTQTPVVPAPQILAGQAHTLFDDEGRLTDHATCGHLKAYLEKLRDWIVRLKG